MADRCPHLKLSKGWCNACSEDVWGRTCTLVGMALVAVLWWVLR